MRAFRWALIQYDFRPYTKVTFGDRHTKRKRHVKNEIMLPGVKQPPEEAKRKTDNRAFPHSLQKNQPGKKKKKKKNQPGRHLNSDF